MALTHRLARFHRIYGGFGNMAFRLSFVLSFAYILRLLAQVPQDGIGPLLVFALFIGAGWMVFIRPPRRVREAADAFPPDPDGGQSGLFPPDRPRWEWRPHHFKVAFAIRIALLAALWFVPFWAAWLLTGDAQMREGALFFAPFVSVVGGMIEAMRNAHAADIAAARATSYLKPPAEVRGGIAPESAIVAEPDAASMTPAQPQPASPWPWPHLVIPVLALPLLLFVGVIASGVAGDSLLSLICGALASAYALGLWVEWSSQGRPAPPAMLLDAGTHGVLALLVAFVCMAGGFAAGFVLYLMFKGASMTVAMLAAGLGTHFAVTQVMASVWRKGPEFGTRSGSTHGRGRAFERWRPSAEIRCPLPSPDRVFFAAPPTEIGEVVAATTSLRADAAPLPPGIRVAYAVGLAIILGGVAWMTAPLVPLPIAGRLAWSAGAVAYGALLGWWLSDFHEYCIFVGRDGVAAFYLEGLRPQCGAIYSLVFSEADTMYSAGTVMISAYLGGQATGEETYEYIWRDAEGGEMLRLAGRFHQRNPREKARAELDEAVSTQWTEHRLRRCQDAIADGHAVVFPLGDCRISISRDGSAVMTNAGHHPVSGWSLDRGVLSVEVAEPDAVMTVPARDVGNLACLLVLLSELAARPSTEPTRDG